MAIIDVFDALINERVYKKAFSLDESVRIIKEGIGSHFDPDIGHAFLQLIDKMASINEKYMQ